MLGESRERKEEEKEEYAEQFSMPHGGMSNWRIDTERKIEQEKYTSKIRK